MLGATHQGQFNVLGVLLNWLNTHGDREERRYLEAHPELLEPAGSSLLTALLQQCTEQANNHYRQLQPRLEEALVPGSPLSDELWERLAVYVEATSKVDDLVRHLRLLDDIRSRGSSIEAIRDAYVNVYGGLVLDIPPWLEEIEQHQGQEITSAEPAISVPARLVELEPPVQAELHSRRFSALFGHLAENNDPGALQEEQIAGLEAALPLYTLERYPLRYAAAQGNLGAILSQRLAGEKRENVERSISCAEQALRVYTLAEFPWDYAATMHNLGIAWHARIAGDRGENLERAIAYFEQALQVYTLDRYPQDYAMSQQSLGETLIDRIAGEKRENLERAIACYTQALLVHDLDHFPWHYGACQNNLGLAWCQRIDGEKGENIERAITCFEQALVVRTLDRFPEDYAMTQKNIGKAYMQRIAGDKSENLEYAAACLEQALQVYTLDSYPEQHAIVQYNLGTAAAEAGDWTRSAAACEGAHDAQDFLLAFSGNFAARDATLHEVIGTATQAAYAQLRVGDYVAAALCIERGRARGLADTLRLRAGDPELIGDPSRRSRFVQARATLSSAQITLNSPVTGTDLEHLLPVRGHMPSTEETQRQHQIEVAIRDIELARASVFQQAKAAFDAVVAEVRQARDPEDFLLSRVDQHVLFRAAARGGSGHALVYLGDTPWGGMALGVFNGNPAVRTAERIDALNLPPLTSTVVFGLQMRSLTPNDGRFIGGYFHAQNGTGFDRFLQDWPGETLRDRALALRAACRDAGCTSTLEQALSGVLTNLSTKPDTAGLAETPLELLSPRDIAILGGSINQAFLRTEVQFALFTLAAAAMQTVATWLEKHQASSVTLIPCGALAAFPLAATEIAAGVTFGERFPTSVEPSARSLVRDEAAHALAQAARSGVAAVGDPRITHQPLPWGEAEALTLAKLARRLGLPAQARVQQKATKEWFSTGWQDSF
ncbi:MAG: CHAT domain-containing protein [Ktedonobacterales bacterium]